MHYSQITRAQYRAASSEARRVRRTEGPRRYITHMGVDGRWARGPSNYDRWWVNSSGPGVWGECGQLEYVGRERVQPPACHRPTARELALDSARAALALAREAMDERIRRIRAAEARQALVAARAARLGARITATYDGRYLVGAAI